MLDIINITFLVHAASSVLFSQDPSVLRQRLDHQAYSDWLQQVEATQIVQVSRALWNHNAQREQERSYLQKRQIYRKQEVWYDHLD